MFSRKGFIRMARPSRGVSVPFVMVHKSCSINSLFGVFGPDLKQFYLCLDRKQIYSEWISMTLTKDWPIYLVEEQVDT